MRKIIKLLPLLFLFCCSDNVINYEPVSNPFNGHWEVHTSGDLPGAATIYVSSAGTINNGIPMLYYNLAEVITYIDGALRNNNLNANFYVKHTFVSETGTISIVSGSGSFSGVFNSNNASGTYQITILDGDTFSGSWTGFKLE